MNRYFPHKRANVSTKGFDGSARDGTGQIRKCEYIDMGIPAFGVKHSDRLGIAFTMTLWPQLRGWCKTLNPKHSFFASAVKVGSN